MFSVVSVILFRVRGFLYVASSPHTPLRSAPYLPLPVQGPAPLEMFKLLAGLLRVSLFIDLGCPEDLGVRPWHFYDK